MEWLGSLDASLASHFAVFVAGLVAGVSPCNLPTVALVVAYVGGCGRGRLRAFGLSAGFVLGLCLTLSALGVVAALAGGLLLRFSVMGYVAAAVCVVMGLALLGVLPLSLPGLGMTGTGRRGFAGAFLLGIPFAFTSSPCTTPVTLAVLSLVAAKAVPLAGATLLLAYALGRGVPLLAAGTLAGSASGLVVSDVWADRLKKTSGLVLVGVGLWLLWQAV